MLDLPNQTPLLAQAIEGAWIWAETRRDEYLLPEHLLHELAAQLPFKRFVPHEPMQVQLEDFVKKYSFTVPEEDEYDGPQPSVDFIELINDAYAQMAASEAESVDVPHVLYGFLHLEHSFARTLLTAASGGHPMELLAEVIDSYGDLRPKRAATPEEGAHEHAPETGRAGGEEPRQQQQPATPLSPYLTCLNDHTGECNPLIGREDELQRTMQVLCRMEKNNPLHVGEPGVGKTAIARGLAALIERGEGVPAPLRGARIYELDLGALIAGTQFRGEFEKRLKEVLASLEGHPGAILYIDEIHTLVGAGRTDGGSVDASNLLKPYLQSGTIRFMGSTTYEEYNKQFLRNKGFARRFEKIDVSEPTPAETKQILRGLKERFEHHHGVTFTDDALDYAVDASARYITGRFLPDKAIDLIDEAGAWRQLHPADTPGTPVVDRRIVSETLAKICHVDTLAEERDDNERLLGLEDALKANVYGQDEAVRQVTEAVQLGAAGLIDDNKPVASLLFVGPTGVGKTEIARVLASELGLPLLRFDMSEYAEKHTVAKLIGSPPGYVGYEEGGLLTDAVSRSPHSVLLFDELEKAHPDIYNILLQVMDYAVLTDSKGRKVDFRHVIFIMTTNAGAENSRRSATGFMPGGPAGASMLKSVRRTFRPEFLNRLTAITVFADMDRHMASLILDKKLRALGEMLGRKGVSITLSPEARERLLEEGFSVEYGGREIDRVLLARLKPLLMREMLFGSLRKGGHATVLPGDEGDFVLQS